jgi:phosphohistidine phosphatase
MLVGHTPHLARLASLLLTGDPEGDFIDFSMGGVACLRREGDRWRLRWLITPEAAQE